jgi:hypothetical protein
MISSRTSTTISLSFAIRLQNYRTAAFLVRNFQTILLPTFETGKMVEHVESRKISNATARTMMCLSHYKFRCKLQDLCGCALATEGFRRKGAVH